MNTYPVTTMYVVPTMVEAMLKEEEYHQKPIKIISSGAKWEERFKTKNPGTVPSINDVRILRGK